VGQLVGGRLLRDILETLRKELEDYFGSINELKQQLRKDLLPKPAALEWYELVKSTGLPLVEGGLLDQPHIWLFQWELVDSVATMYAEVDQMNQKMKNGA
jgi:hypothetical protein